MAGCSDRARATGGDPSTCEECCSRCFFRETFLPGHEGCNSNRAGVIR